MHQQVTITGLVKIAGENSRDHGFHDDWPDVNDIDSVDSAVAQERQLGLAITEKLALIHEEISETLGEIRSGHHPLDVYYTQKGRQGTFGQQEYQDGLPVGKPEGFGIELADAMIRIADLAYLTGIDLEALVLEKAEYNATRPFKHGRKF